ncbi:MAG: PAS domain S-box protein, partial [Candidatus Heimdallarchaeota archaeon]|nr:PAS domain S-box protein [Candidatus Heimdallarchaeota archaeon]
ALLFIVFVYANNPKSKLNRVFVVYSTIEGIMEFGKFQFISAKNLEIANFWDYFVYLWPFASILQYHLVMIFTNNSTKPRDYIIPYSFPSIFFLYLIFTNNKPDPVYNGDIWIHGEGESNFYIIIIIWIAIYTIYSLITLYSFHNKTNILRLRKQSQFIFSIILLQLISGIVTGIKRLNLFYLPGLAEYVYIFVSIIIGYAIWKYGLFKITPESIAENLFNNLPDPVLVINSENIITAVNEEFTELVNYSETDLIGTSIFNLVEIKNQNDLRFTNIKSHKSLSFEVEFKTAVGKQIPVLLIGTYIVERQNDMEGILFYIRRIDSLKRAENILKGEGVLNVEIIDAMISNIPQIQNRESYFRNLLENNSEPILVVDKNRIIKFLNPAVEQIFQKPIESIIDTKFEFPIELKKPYQMELNLENQIKFLELRASETQWNENTAFLIILQDITNKVLMERFLRQNKDQLLQSQKMEAVGRLSGAIAHDFNNLLTVILGNSEIMLNSSKDKYRDELNEIKSASERAILLTKQLLTFSKKQVVKSTFIQLNSTINIMSPMLDRLAGSNIKLQIKVDKDLAAIKAEESRIEQVILNLFINAKDAINKQGTIHITLMNSVLKHTYVDEYITLVPGTYVLLSVKDTGSGIDELIKPRIFEPYFTTKSEQGGSGLGLATIYGIVNQFNGQITLRSEKNHGTEFKIYFPAYIDVPIIPENTTLVEIEQVKHTNQRILVVEDMESLLSLMEKTLKSQGFQIITANNGVDGLQIIKNSTEKLDLIITDLIMPNMSGLDMIKNSVDHLNGTKILFVSGYPDQISIESLTTFPDSEVIEKPFTQKQLINKINRLLNQDI